MSYITPDEATLKARSQKFVRRIFIMRQLGTTLCFIAIASVMWDMHYNLFYFALLAVNAFVWPTVACLFNTQSHDPVKTGHNSLIVDCALGGIWIAVMGLSPIPSLIIFAVLIADRYAVGGWELLKPALATLFLALFITWSLLGYPLHLTFNQQIVWMSLPLATIYMISLSIVLRDLSVRLSKRNREFERIAMMDPRLHIPNRRLFEKRLASTFIQTQRDHHFAYVMLLDVDHFKEINDNYGHEIGDYILLEISNILRQTLSTHDIPARFGGDELAVIAIHYKEEDVLELAKLIVEKVKALRLTNHHLCRVSISVGIASVKDAYSTTDWLRKADQALYQVKNSGRDNFSLYQDPKRLPSKQQ
ncbi:diguanylate cyclase [Acinetobacter sp. MB5]|uniref:diguanylate cyclase n=1 Tax=Acinetobacter sp. MB5 TaxID=2069438 RepID=UPI000DD01E99|nr:diguanylate cyclase [Acinetobacter sp. MB5]